MIIFEPYKTKQIIQVGKIMCILGKDENPRNLIGPVEYSVAIANLRPLIKKN